MEPMTPEERFTKIENALQALTETQARHDTQIGDLVALMEKQNAHIEKQDAHIEKQNAGIRDLIVVSRAFLESQKEHDLRLTKLEEMQSATFRAIDRLTDNIQKLIQGRGPNGNP